MSGEDSGGPRGRFAGRLLLAFAAVAPVLIVYVFVLIERKYAVFFGKQAFLVAAPLSVFERALFAIAFPFELGVLFLTASVIVANLARRAMRGSPRAAELGVVLTALLAFSVFTTQFQALRYFRDAIDLGVARELGGDDLGAALAYVREELMGLFPLLVAAAVGFLIVLVLLRRFGGRLAAAIGARPGLRRWVGWRMLVLLNLVALTIPPTARTLFWPLDQALRRSLAHEVYTAPWLVLTDFDGDGYGWMSRPRDHEPFDGDLHPFAREVIGNGIDENGVGGDLARSIWNRTPESWDGHELARRNVLLIVLESARADLVSAREGDEPVMPTLAAAPGQVVSVVSHMAFTSPSVVSILTGSLCDEEPGISLFDRFGGRGYRTGVFSGQHEGFGAKAERAGMLRADVFRDASTEPEDRRMYAGTSPASLKMPAPVMNARFFAWLDEGPSEVPFFAYLNWQEMHFPYDWDGAPRPLTADPLPRKDIALETRARLVSTYHNAARNADDALREVLDGLRERGRFADTLILVVGDHGEELFDQGSLGHGTFLCHEQNVALGKLINGPRPVPEGPVGLADVPRLLHDALRVNDADRLEIAPVVLCMTGSARTPNEIGLFSAAGLLKYDFRDDVWTRQARIGERFEAAEPSLDLIHLWESYVVERLPRRDGETEGAR